jgi:hypothetical protein
MNKRCFYTSFNRAYAPQAMVLADSLRQTYGSSVDVVALLVDELDGEDEKYFASFNAILKSSELNIPDYRPWIFGLDIVEAATAVKPFALRHLLSIYEEVIYMDPDTIVYSPLDEMFEALAISNLVLTPHQLVPSTEKWVIESTELESLRFGVFNLGFIGVRKSELGMKVADWWSDRCYDYCISDTQRGLFTDQKLFDLAPAFFPKMHVLTHSGYNLASWNIRERTLTFEKEKGVQVNGQPLRFCHFTKATYIGAFALERMTNGYCIMNELFFAYLALLEKQTLACADLDKKWHYGYYVDGTTIEAETRRIFRRVNSKTHLEIDPFKSRLSVEAIISASGGYR